MESQWGAYKNKHGSKPRPESSNKNVQLQLRKPRKYHEECFTADNKLTTEKRIRYKEDKTESKTKGQKDDKIYPKDDKICPIGEKPISRLKRKPRVEDKAFDDVQSKATNNSCKSHHRKNCSKYSGKGKKHSEEITRADDKCHIRKKELLLRENGENAAKSDKRRHHNKEIQRKSEEMKQIEGDSKRNTQRRAGNEPLEECLAAGEHRRKSRHGGDENDKRLKREKCRKVNREEEGVRRQKETRNCYSDSEIDQTRTHISSCAATCRTRKSDDTGNDKEGAKPINVTALYNFFYKEESKASRRQRSKENNTKPDLPKRKEQNPETELPSECKQSSIRGKLIRVLFKRVKDLLKETEKLRDERKEFMTRIDKLTNQVSGLQLKEEEHITSELRIKERLNVIANDIDVTDKGTSFRDEIQSILNDIQTKYASHWKHHDYNIQQVQTQAGDQLQSLMKNVVGKYMKLSDIQQQSTASSSSTTSLNGFTTNNSVKATEFCPATGYYNTETGYLPMPAELMNSSSRPADVCPISGYHNAETGYLPMTGKMKSTSLNTEKQQVTDSISITMDNSSTSTMDTVLQNTQYQQSLNPIPEKYTNNRNGNNFPFRYMRPLYVDTGIGNSLQQQKNINTGYNLLKIADPQRPKFKQNTPPSSSEHYSQTEADKHDDENNKEHTPLLNEVEKLKTKEELKEFWRHKLLQPNPLETLRKEEKEFLKPNHSDNKSKDMAVYSRNQY